MIRSVVNFFTGKKQEKERQAAERLGVHDPHPFSVETSKEIMIPASALPTLFTNSQLNAYMSHGPGPQEDVVPMSIHFVHPYTVPRSSVTRGCHGNYSLAQSLEFDEKYGADPICGGGIKSLFPPKKLEAQAEEELALIVSRNSINGSLVIPKAPHHEIRHLTVYVGNPDNIVAYLGYITDPRWKYPFYFDDEGLRKFKEDQEEQRRRAERGESFSIMYTDTDFKSIETREVTIQIAR